MHQRLADAAALVRTERFEARVGPGCRYCPFRGSCPAQPAGRQVVSMSVSTLVTGSRTRRFHSHRRPRRRPSRVPFSDQQLTAITAPLEPGVIIAGAGSGKTTVMAARVVWLVGTGAVRPEEVLGLTFTRKAAAELSSRVRAALLRAGVVADSGVDESGEQLIMTYDAFAARLVAEHGLRLGFEADPTMITGATRYRLAARVVKAAAGPFEFLSRLRPATVTERVLRLDADLQQHLVDPADLDKHARDLLVALESAPLNNRGGNVYADVAKADGDRPGAAGAGQPGAGATRRSSCGSGWSSSPTRWPSPPGSPGGPGGLRRPAVQLRRVVLLDEYQDTSAAQAHDAARAVLRGRRRARGWVTR